MATRTQSHEDVRAFIETEENDALTAYLQEIGRIPLLSAEDEIRLAQQIEAGRAELQKLASKRDQAVIEAGEQARDRFITANLRLVVDQVRQFQAHRHTHLKFLDLVQEGNIGLLHALEKFDYTKGYKFSTYAVWWIHQALGRAYDKQSRTVRVPVHLSQKISQVRRAIRALSEQGETPTLENIAAHIELDPQAVRDILSKDYTVVSLEKPFQQAEDHSFRSLLAEHTEREMTERIAKAELIRGALEQAGLTARERRVLELRYGLAGNSEHTLEEVGQAFHVTRERIRQIEAAAFYKVRPFLS